MSDLRVDTLQMPAARLGPENPLPPLSTPGVAASADVRCDDTVPEADRKYFGYGSDTGVLPHRLQDDYGRQRRPRAFKVAILENEVLRATFLLELGGRLWSLVHKPSARELLDVNPVFQPANLALRNAWFSGGVEWNVAVRAHTPQTCSPLFAARVKGYGGSPILRLYEWDRMRGIPHQLDFSLPDGSEMLFVRIRLLNPHEKVTPMYWWSNIAVRERPDLRVVAPAERTFRHNYDGTIGVLPIPVVDGIDVTYPTNVPTAADFFWYVEDGQRPWITALDAEGKGLVQTSTSRLRGRKLFVWGMGPGGRRWQEFLSVPRHPYIEIQAGLARTQSECLPMPAGAEWSWMEAYGLMEGDAKAAHGSDWAAARNAVAARLEEMLPEQWLEQELVRTAEAADRPPEEIIHRGPGWGALERRRREAAGDKPFCSAGMVFDDASLGADQEPWLALLQRGELPHKSPDEEPGAWMVQDEWRHMLEDAVREGRGDHWLSWLHMGVMRYEADDIEGAREAWEMSLSLEPSAWAYRNLAVLADQEGEQSKAVEMWITACRMAPQLVPLAVECCEALIRAGRQAEVPDLLDSLSPDVADHPRVRVLTARAALDTGDLETVERILLGGVELSDLREGEDVLTELWFGMQEKRLAAEEGVEVDEALRERVRREFPPPPEIDFRMAAKASDAEPTSEAGET